jgi:serine/threonine-protein kinase HipA
MSSLSQCIVFLCADPANPIPVASFALDSKGDGHFGYGLRYLEREDAFPLDPLHLPLSVEPHLIRRPNDSAYGILSDAGPNSWGMRLTSSIFRKQRRALPATPVEWLLQSWHYGSGCLGFSAAPDILPDSGISPAPLAALDKRLLSVIGNLAVHADTALDDEAVRLMYPGGSLGGVRPKTVVLHDGMEHIAKFSRQDDRFDVPAAEYATLRLAHMAGIHVPDFELVDIDGRSVLLIERFDRTKASTRLHYMSARTLVDIDTLSPDGREYKARYSYAGIAEAMRPLNARGVADSHELFRRMVFNILVGNVDDHMRNHAFLMDKPGRFHLSPAFDLVPHLEAMSVPQSIGVGAYGTASTVTNAMSQCGRFLLRNDEAARIIQEIREVVSHWRRIFREAGMSETDIHTLTACFNAADEAERIQVAAGRAMHRAAT